VPFDSLLACCESICEKKEMAAIFKGTERFHNETESQYHSGLIVVKGDQYQVINDRAVIVTTSSPAEALAIFVGALIVFEVAINKSATIKRLVNIK